LSLENGEWQASFPGRSGGAFLVISRDAHSRYDRQGETFAISAHAAAAKSRLRTRGAIASSVEILPGVPVDQDRRLFVSLALVLLGFGVLMVHSASITSRPTEFEQVYLSRHLVFVGIGLVAAAAAACLPPRVWMRIAPFLLIVTLALLVAVLVPGVGTRVKGAQRWLRLGGISLQPSELAKVTLPLLLCTLATRWRGLLRSWLFGPIVFITPVALVVPLVVLQPDLGTALFLAAGAGLVLFLGGWPLRNFILGGLLAAPALGSLVLLRPYQMRRITGFIAAWTDFNQAPYQLQQSLVTIGAGGVWGVGLGKGWQKLSFLPEANTDFVFAVIGEELGLLGTLSLLGLWAGLYYVGLQIIRRLPADSFEYLASITLLTQLVFQAALNVAVVTAMVPPKGISHPLVSYGGSNLVMSLVSVGIILGLTRQGRRTTEQGAESDLGE
jgi:cell division protein FtsW